MDGSRKHVASEQTDELDVILACLRLMETTVAGLELLRDYVPNQLAVEMLDLLIEDNELEIAAIRNRILQ